MEWLILTLFCYQYPVPFRHGERIGFSYLVSQKYTGDTALVKVLRSSEILEYNVKLATHKRLIPAHIKGKPPSYYIIAGFVFTTVSVPYLRSEVCRLPLMLPIFLFNLPPVSIYFLFICFIRRTTSSNNLSGS